MGFGIEQANVGYDAAGIQEYINKLKTNLVDELTEKISQESLILNEKVDEVWQGKSAEAFKAKFANDANVTINNLNELITSLEAEFAKIKNNYDANDEQLAASIGEGGFY